MSTEVLSELGGGRTKRSLSGSKECSKMKDYLKAGGGGERAFAAGPQRGKKVGSVADAGNPKGGKITEGDIKAWASGKGSRRRTAPSRKNSMRNHARVKSLRKLNQIGKITSKRQTGQGTRGEGGKKLTTVASRRSVQGENKTN